MWNIVAAVCHKSLKAGLKSNIKLEACYWKNVSVQAEGVVCLSFFTWQPCPPAPNTTHITCTPRDEVIAWYIGLLCEEKQFACSAAPGNLPLPVQLCHCFQWYYSFSSRQDDAVWLTESFLFHSVATKPAFHWNVKAVKDSSPTCFSESWDCFHTAKSWRGESNCIE